MKATKILNSEISDLKIASLPSKPTAPKALGGKGYSAKEMKEAFDRLPLLIIQRYNDLIDDISDTGEDSLASSIKTGIKTNHTLTALFCDIMTGEFASYFNIFGESLASHLIGIKSDIADIKKHLATSEVG